MKARVRRSLRLPFLLLAALPAILSAPAMADEDPFAGALFPPELIFSRMSELGLDAAQVTAIKEEIRKAQSLFLDRQLDLQAEMGRLRRSVEPATVDESATLAQLDRVLALEREIKRAQVGLLVRIKNLLRPDQQRQLAALTRERPR
jgi:Spy/CpxP family protein refolding chaperone